MLILRLTKRRLATSLSLLAERNSEDHRQEEAHFQAGTRGVHRPGEDRDRVHSERPGGPDLCPRRQLAGIESFQP